MNLFRHLLFWIVLALAGALIAQLLLQDPGFVLVRYRGTRYESTLAAVLLLAAVAAFVLWALWKLMLLPFRLWRRRRERTARARLGDGLDALHQGHYARAEKLLNLAAQDRQFEAPARTAAARAALTRGDHQAAAAHLDALAARHPASRAIAIADYAQHEGRHADAVTVLDAVNGPLPPRAQRLRAEALAADGRAAEAYGMLGALRQQQALSTDALAERERDWAALALRGAADANALADHWDALTPALRNDAAVVLAYAERAADLRWDQAAASSIEQALAAHWDETLAAFYGGLSITRLDTAAIEQRRTHAEAWLQQHPSSPGALLGLARMLRAQQQWPLAEQYLHRAIAQSQERPDWHARAWEELGHGFTQANEDARARPCYANALRAQRGEATEPLPGRDLRQHILDHAAIEERDAHGVPRLRE
jgi:HemY protein